ncbi:hypothetical protein [uncultured Jannaschia sp.]|uniref:hypothetical protein n=1 Tax=uncultured Jannaschia sp. TaxID=293347 RepID=UPI002607AA14|nr:hypothetical protein [uncultured Jannaschia sp.]
MDSKGQAEGEKAVRTMLIEPLLQRGLARPASLTKAQFDDMVDSLCAKLAYMSAGNLAALEEVVAANPGGKDKDRLPIANRVLEWAAQIQPPGDDASPLIRAVFANELGRDALSGGWAPELLAELKLTRRWPGSFVVVKLKERADDAVRQMTRLDERLAAGDDLTVTEAEWRARRAATLDRCRRIAALSSGVTA